jgi:hypothetical protein
VPLRNFFLVAKILESTIYKSKSSKNAGSISL